MKILLIFSPVEWTGWPLPIFPFAHPPPRRRRSALQVIERLEAMLDKAMVEAREGRKVCQRCPSEH